MRRVGSRWLIQPATFFSGFWTPSRTPPLGGAYRSALSPPGVCFGAPIPQMVIAPSVFERSFPFLGKAAQTRPLRLSVDSIQN